MIRHFHELIKAAQARDLGRAVILAPTSAASLTCAVQAQNEAMAQCTLIGDLAQTRELAHRHEIDLSLLSLIDQPAEEDAIRQAIHLCRKGQADLLVRDGASLRAFLPAVLDSETGLSAGGLLTGVSALETQELERLLLVSDGLMLVSPDLDQRVTIVEQAVQVAHSLGIDRPKVALVAATETVNPRSQFSIDAAQITLMSMRNQIKNAVIDGPLGLDNAISARAAEIKNITSQVAGDVSILIVPDLEAGSLLVKTLSALCNVPALNIVVGGKVPLVWWSPADDAQTRLAALGLGVLCS
jgi:phosphotransacetylase